jgi:hypothetical protein
LLGSNAPLIVVDGFPFGDAGNMKQINTDNIEICRDLKRCVCISNIWFTWSKWRYSYYDQKSKKG